MFRQLATCAFTVVLLCSSVRAAGNITDGPNADLRYDAGTGNVILDPSDLLGLSILSYDLRNEDDSFRTENARFPYIDVGTNIVNTPSEIGALDAIAIGFREPFDIGDILPAGFTNAEELAGYLSEAQYASGAGGTPPIFDLIVVPEPTLGLHLTFALLALFAARGNQRSRWQS